MRTLRRLAHWAVAAAALACSALVLARSSYEGVTVVVAQRLSGGTLAQTEEPEVVRKLMRDINEQRGRLWTGFRGDVGRCAVRLSFFDGNRLVGRLVLDRSKLIEFVGASRSTGMQREVSEFEMRDVRNFAARVVGSACVR